MTKALWKVTVSRVAPGKEPRLVAQGHWEEGSAPRLDTRVPPEVLEAFKRLSPLPTDLEGNEKVSADGQDYLISFSKDITI